VSSASSTDAARLIEYLSRENKRLRPLTILTHDHPDPDSMASAWALAYLAHGLWRLKTRIVYGGVIGRAENRIMAERLSIPIYPIKAGEIRQAAHVVLIDTQPPFKNNRFAPRRHADMIIDHHPRHPQTQADFILIDQSAGATSTILAEALLLSGLRIPKKLATAIIYGIGSETQNLGREAGPRDMAAYQAFWPFANMRMLWKISYPKRSSEFFADLARGIRNAYTCGRTIGVNLGELNSPDAVAQIADFLLTHERMSWSVVTGRYKGRLHISLRTNDPAGAAGRLLKRLLGGGNRGGGHLTMAGGSIEIGEGASEHEWRKAEEKIESAFLESRGFKTPFALSYPFRV